MMSINFENQSLNDNKVHLAPPSPVKRAYCFNCKSTFFPFFCDGDNVFCGVDCRTMNAYGASRRPIRRDEEFVHVSEIVSQKSNNQHVESKTEPTSTVSSMNSEDDLPALEKRVPSGLSLVLMGESSPVMSSPLSKTPPSPLAFPEVEEGMPITPFTP
eukprot:349393_1